MPKVVDPVQRRALIHDALFDVVVAHGLPKVTLRRVAEAAGLAIGSVRHYFDSAEQLLTAAADEAINRLQHRLEVHRDRLFDSDDQDTRLEVATDMLCELLPLDSNSRREVLVWLEIALAARTVPELADAGARLHEGTRILTRVFVEHCDCPADRLDFEADRLAAFVDGLSLRMALRPAEFTDHRARELVREHLAATRAEFHARQADQPDS